MSAKRVQPGLPATPARDRARPARPVAVAEPSAEPAARPQRLTAVARKAQIADVAIALFGRKGFSGTTTKAIATAARISEATIFKHFPSKADLYAEAFRRRTEAGMEWLVERLHEHAERKDDLAVVRLIAESVLFGFERDRDLHRMLMYAWLDQEADANRRMERQMESPLFEFLAGYVTRRQAEGAFRAGDPRLMAFALTALAVNYATRTKLYGLEPVADDATVAEGIARLLLDGMRVAPTSAGAPGPGGSP